MAGHGLRCCSMKCMPCIDEASVLLQGRGGHLHQGGRVVARLVHHVVRTLTKLAILRFEREPLPARLIEQLVWQKIVAAHRQQC